MNQLLYNIMEMIDIFNDVLTTERRPSLEIGPNKSESEPNITLNFSKMSFYVNPTYFGGEEAKPYTVSSKYIPKKKHKRRKSAESAELTQLLALAEIRFLNNVNKIKEAITSNKKIHLMCIINFIKTIYPIIKRLKVLIKKTYWYKWICINRESNSNRPASLAFKLWSFLTLWKKITKRNKMRTFIIFKERGIIYELGIQYYGIDSISRKKLSKYVPPFNKEHSNKARLEKILENSSKNSDGNLLQILKEKKKNRSYFK